MSLNVKLRKHRNNGVTSMKLSGEQYASARLSLTLHYAINMPFEADEVIHHYSSMPDVSIQHRTKGRGGFMEIIILLEVDGESHKKFTKFEYLYKKGILRYT